MKEVYTCMLKNKEVKEESKEKNGGIVPLHQYGGVPDTVIELCPGIALP